MSEEALAADRLDGFPHPRERRVLFGHEAAERTLRAAYGGPRPPHAWIIGGPEGIGKATLAYRFARFILSYPRPDTAPDGDDLALAAETPAAARIDAGAHPDLLALRRVASADKDRPPQDIPVALVRRMVPFFGSTPAEGGWRVCLIDAAEDLNRSGANAILKLVEEPPARAIVLIVSHAPGRLLPTIRSRCRMIRLDPLSEADMRRGLASFAAPVVPEVDLDDLVRRGEGSLRRALAFAGPETRTFAGLVEGALARLPNADRNALHAIGDRLAKRDAFAFDHFVTLVQDRLHADLRGRAGEGPRRLAPLPEVWEKVAEGAERVKAFNLDPKPFVFQVFGWLEDGYRRL